jgi:hypothetical protein
MGGLYLTWLADELRAAGVKVVEFDGWRTRARSSGGFAPGRPWCVMLHHTASSPKQSAQSDAAYMCQRAEARPVANILLTRTGEAWVLAAGPTNTNGKGGPVKVSKGTVPKDSMNSYAVGIEIQNSGVGEPYTQACIDAMFACSIAIGKRLGLAPTDVMNHATWAPSRKIDPACAAGVQGPWKPRQVSSAGTWDLRDIVTEHERRWRAGRPTTTPAPAPLIEEDDLPYSKDELKQIMRDVQYSRDELKQIMREVLNEAAVNGSDGTFKDTVKIHTELMHHAVAEARAAKHAAEKSG